MKQILLVIGNLFALYGLYSVINSAFISYHFIVPNYFPGKNEINFSVFSMLLILPIMGLVMLFVKKWRVKLIGIIYLFFFTWAIELFVTAFV